MVENLVSISMCLSVLFEMSYTLDSVYQILSENGRAKPGYEEELFPYPVFARLLFPRPRSSCIRSRQTNITRALIAVSGYAKVFYSV